MRIVYCGSGSVASECLARLVDSSHEILSVFSQPPRRAGRGSKLTPTPVADLAHSRGIELHEVANINAPEPSNIILSSFPGILVVVDFGQKIGNTLLDTPPFGAINMHASLLPELRGAAPINRAIIQGRRTTGVTTFRLVEKMDAGPVLMQHSTEILPDENAEHLRERLAKMGAELILQTLDELADGTLKARAQDDSAATFAHKLSKSDGAVDFTRAARTIADQVHGCWPWPGAFALFNHRGGKGPVRLIFQDVRAVEAPPVSRKPGELDDELRIVTGDGLLEVRKLKVAGKSLMDWRDFHNGYRAMPGDTFISAMEAGNE